MFGPLMIKVSHPRWLVYCSHALPISIKLGLQKMRDQLCTVIANHLDQCNQVLNANQCQNCALFFFWQPQQPVHICWPKTIQSLLWQQWIWVGAPLSRLTCVQFFLVLYFNLKSWEVGCIYLFIYLLLSSPCVLLYHMGGHQNLYGPYMCVCVCFSLGYFLLLIDLS